MTDHFVLALFCALVIHWVRKPGARLSALISKTYAARREVLRQREECKVKHLLDHPSVLVSVAARDVLLAMLTATVVVIIQTTDIERVPEIRMMLPEAIYKTYMRQIIDTTAWVTDVVTVIVWVFILRRIRFYRQIEKVQSRDA